MKDWNSSSFTTKAFRVVGFILGCVGATMALIGLIEINPKIFGGLLLTAAGVFLFSISDDDNAR